MTAELYAALSRAQARVRGVAKDATNSFHRYDYASAEAVIDEARHALASCDLSASQTSLRVIYHPRQTEPITDAKGRTRAPPQTGEIRMRLRLAHKSGEHADATYSWHWEADSGRPPDKAGAGAATTCRAYARRGLLLIPRGIVGEVRADDRDDRDYQPPPPEDHAERERLRDRYQAAVNVLGRDVAHDLVGALKGRPTAEVAAAVATLEAAVREQAAAQRPSLEDAQADVMSQAEAAQTAIKGSGRRGFEEAMVTVGRMLTDPRMGTVDGCAALSDEISAIAAKFLTTRTDWTGRSA
ncbi:MAG: ERF family protein [Planctomycetota bacterium]